MPQLLLNDAHFQVGQLMDKEIRKLSNPTVLTSWLLQTYKKWNLQITSNEHLSKLLLKYFTWTPLQCGISVFQLKEHLCNSTTQLKQHHSNLLFQHFKQKSTSQESTNTTKLARQEQYLPPPLPSNPPHKKGYQDMLFSKFMRDMNIWTARKCPQKLQFSRAPFSVITEH